MRKLLLIALLIAQGVMGQKINFCDAYNSYDVVMDMTHGDTDQNPKSALAAFTFGHIVSKCLEDGKWRGLGSSDHYNVNIRYFQSQNRVIAYAESPKEGDLTIVVDPDKWLELNKLERSWLIAHEYMHEKYGAPHGEGQLMFPVIPDLSIKSGLSWEDRKSKLYSAFVEAWSIIDKYNRGLSETIYDYE